jgi:hypothetical protein
MVYPATGLRVFIRMEQAPGVLARVLGPFAVSGFAPCGLFLRPSPRATAFVVADFEGLECEQASLLVTRLQQMPCVCGARFRAFPRAP